MNKIEEAVKVGRKGGQTTLKRHGTEHFRRIGRLRWKNNKKK